MDRVAPEVGVQAHERSGRVRFAQAEFDCASLELRVEGVPVAIERLPLELLRLLLSQPGKVFDKDELQRQLWPGRLLSETVLPRCVTKLRKALSDVDQKVIRTVHGYGYRLDVPIEHLSDEVETLSRLAAGDTPPLRPEWRLIRALSGNGVWLAAHQVSNAQRIFHFVARLDDLSRLRDALDLLGRWVGTLPSFQPVQPVVGWNEVQLPYFMETDAVPCAPVDAAALPTSPRIMLVEDQDETRERLARAISASDDLQLVGQAAGYFSALEVFERCVPDVVLVDLGLPDGSGIDLIRQLRALRPQTLFMVITVFGDERHVVAAIEAGAVAYLLKDTTAKGVARSIRALCAGGSPISPSVARFLVRLPQESRDKAPVQRLPTDDRQLLEYVDKGYTEEDLRDRLGVTVDELRQRIRRIYQRLAS